MTFVSRSNPHKQCFTHCGELCNCEAQTYGEVMKPIKNFDEAVKMMSDYHYITLPTSIFHQVLTANPDLIDEVEHGCAYDTDVRDRICNAVLKFVGVSMEWPTYGESRTDPTLMGRFLEEAKKKIEAFGGTFDTSEF